MYKNALRQYQPPDAKSLKTLIEQDSHLCPICSQPFQRTAGCGEMYCRYCCEFFLFINAPTVKEAQEVYEERQQRVDARKARASYRRAVLRRLLP